MQAKSLVAKVQHRTRGSRYGEWTGKGYQDIYKKTGSVASRSLRTGRARLLKSLPKNLRKLK